MRLDAIHRFGLVIRLCARARRRAGARRRARDAERRPTPSPRRRPDPMDASSSRRRTHARRIGRAQNALSDPSVCRPPSRQNRCALPSLAAPKVSTASRTDKPDGSTAMVLKQPLPVDWDAKVGADLGLRAAPSLTYSPDPWMAGSRDQRSSGAAWASVGLVPNFATVDARVDPSNDQGRIGTTFKHIEPLGSRLSVTLQNTYSVTETFSASTAATPTDIPMMAVPVTRAAWRRPRSGATSRPPSSTFCSTGTSFGAKLANQQHRPSHAQSVQRRTKGLRPAECDHRGHRCRPDHAPARASPRDSS